MKNDYDDYDDYENSGSRWVSIMVLLLAVAGFVALAWYAYQTGSEQVKTASDVVVIEADKTPVKEKPEDAGGMEFPHQEKTIYDAISSGEKKEEKPVEVVEKAESFDEELAESESAPEVTAESGQEASKPVKERADEKISKIMKEVSESDSKTESVDADEAAANALKEKDQPKAEEPKEVAKKAAKEVVAKAEPVKQVIKEVPVAAVKAESVKPAPAPAVAPDPFAKVETVQPVTAPAQAPAPVAPAPVAAASAAQIQLGAYGSQAEAEQNWAKIRASHASVVGSMPHQIVRADLGPKGIFYRLRVSGFASAVAAKQTCAALSARGQGCFLVQ